MPETSDTERKNLYKAKKLLMKARLYRFVSLCFALVGVLIFLYFYLVHVEGRFFAAFRSPSVIFILIFPFLPAALLSWLGSRAERKFFRMTRNQD